MKQNAAIGLPEAARLPEQIQQEQGLKLPCYPTFPNQMLLPEQIQQEQGLKLELALFVIPPTSLPEQIQQEQGLKLRMPPVMQEIQPASRANPTRTRIETC